MEIFEHDIDTNYNSSAYQEWLLGFINNPKPNNPYKNYKLLFIIDRKYPERKDSTWFSDTTTGGYYDLRGKGSFVFDNSGDVVGFDLDDSSSLSQSYRKTYIGLFTQLDYDDLIKVEFTYPRCNYKILDIYYLDKDSSRKAINLVKLYTTFNELETLTTMPDMDFVKSLLLSYKGHKDGLFNVQHFARLQRVADQRKKLEEEKALKEFYYHRFEEII